MSKVNFKVFDQYVIKPVDIYGSKEEIVRFLVRCLLCIMHQLILRTAELLADLSTLGQSQQVLLSGLYPVEQQSNAEEQVFVIYWPEGNTWYDFACCSDQRQEKGARYSHRGV